MKYQVVVEAQAAADIADYARWILSQGAPLNATRWVEGIEHEILSLETMPHRCPEAPEAELLGIDIRQLLFKSHRVLFVIHGDAVRVLHVRHGAQRPLSLE